MIYKTKASRIRQVALAVGICFAAISANASEGSEAASDTDLKSVLAVDSVNTGQTGKFALTELDVDTARSLTAGMGKVVSESEGQGLLSLTELTSEEAKQLKGGTFFAALTRNQMTVAVTGAVVWGTWRTAMSAIGNPTFTTVAQSAADSIICKGLPLITGVFLGQSQISAGKVDARNLGLVDVILGLTHGTILASGSALCSIGVSAASLNTNSNTAGRKLLELQLKAYAAQPTALGRKNLQDKWTAQDQLMNVRATSADSYMNKAAAYSDLIGELRFLRNGCGINPLCYADLNRKISNAQTNRDNNIKSGETTMTQAGQLAEARMDTYGGDIMKAKNAATLSPSSMSLRKQWVDPNVCIGC
jgi:hypothetical protein